MTTLESALRFSSLCTRHEEPHWIAEYRTRSMNLQSDNVISDRRLADMQTGPNLLRPVFTQQLEAFAVYSDSRKNECFVGENDVHDIKLYTRKPIEEESLRELSLQPSNIAEQAKDVCLVAHSVDIDSHRPGPRRSLEHDVCTRNVIQHSSVLIRADS